MSNALSRTKAVKASTIYGIFIIESLRSDDFRDGKRLHEVLNLCRIESLYRYANTKAEFESQMVEFLNSGFRYLFMSCHAGFDGLEIGNESISNAELLPIFKSRIKGRRLFFSACEAANRYMATLVIDKCKGQSVIGAPMSVGFDDSAVFWPSFFYVMARTDNERMNQKSLTKSLQKCVSLFGHKINYYHASKKEGFLVRYRIRRGKVLEAERVRLSKKLGPA